MTTEGAVAEVDRHQADLLMLHQYTPKERRRVLELFTEERAAIWFRENGGDINLTGIRQRIAHERCLISRAARKRGAQEWQPSLNLAS